MEEEPKKLTRILKRMLFIDPVSNPNADKGVGQTRLPAV